MTLYLGNELVANSVTVPYNWSGTKAEYEALETINPEWVYYITDDTDVTLSLLETIYPVGSIYITTNTTCPLSALFGTWQLVAGDRVLQGAGSRGAVGTTVNESLPNIRGFTDWWSFGGGANNPTGAFLVSAYLNSSPYGGDQPSQLLSFDASRSSSTYQDNAPVQPNAYLVNIFRRVS